MRARYSRDGGWLIAELLFVTGWSLMWASALNIISFVPLLLCPLAMLVGAALPGFLLRRDNLNALKPVSKPQPKHDPEADAA